MQQALEALVAPGVNRREAARAYAALQRGVHTPIAAPMANVPLSPSRAAPGSMTGPAVGASMVPTPAAYSSHPAAPRHIWDFSDTRPVGSRIMTMPAPHDPLKPYNAMPEGGPQPAPAHHRAFLASLAPGATPGDLPVGIDPATGLAMRRNAGPAAAAAGLAAMDPMRAWMDGASVAATRWAAMAPVPADPRPILIPFRRRKW